MSDLIDKQTVIDALYDWREHSMTDAEAWHLKQVIFDIKCMPSLELMVLVCYGNGSIRFDTYMNGEWVRGNPIAWMPLPEPWIGDR